MMIQSIQKHFYHFIFTIEYYQYKETKQLYGKNMCTYVWVKKSIKLLKHDPVLILML